MTIKERYFGDENTFAIRYLPGYSDKGKQYFYANCHLVLGGQIIGNKKEICYVNSWIRALKTVKDKIENKFNAISHPEFEGKNDRELFELIFKANQIEDDYKTDYDYLPVLDNTVWRDCMVSLDETTDAFSIIMTGQNNRIKFLWQGLRDPCPASRINKLYSVIVDKELVLDAMQNCFQTIESEYLNYPAIE